MQRHHQLCFPCQSPGPKHLWTQALQLITYILASHPQALLSHKCPYYHPCKHQYKPHSYLLTHLTLLRPSIEQSEFKNLYKPYSNHCRCILSISKRTQNRSNSERTSINSLRISLMYSTQLCNQRKRNYYLLKQ